MSEMSFEDILREYKRNQAASEKRDVPGDKDDLNPKDYTSIVYLRNGDAYEHPGTMAADIGVRIMVTNGIEKLTAYNADHVLFWEVVLTSTLEADSE